jgi:cytochrome c oxidase subunit 2
MANAGAAATRAAAGSLDPQGPAADAIADLFWLMLGLGAVVLAVFGLVLALGLRRREAERGAARPDRFGRWFLLGGVAGPLIVLVVVFAATVHAMRVISPDRPAEALVVEVVGHRFWWEVRYPGERVSVTNELHIPVGRPVELRLTSADVIHSFWVPALAGKRDLLPDHVNTLVLRADEPGVHRAQCAEFCGLGHASMVLTVVAEPPDRFAAWVADRRD